MSSISTQSTAYLRDCHQVQASTSIIHDIVARIEKRKKALQESIPVKISSSSSSSFNADHDLQQVVRGDEVLFDIHHALDYYDVVPQGGPGIELMDAWRSHRNMYNQRMKAIRKQQQQQPVDRSPTSNDRRSSFGGGNSSPLPPSNDADNKKNSITREYITLFDAAAIKLWEEYMTRRQSGGHGHGAAPAAAGALPVDQLSMRRVLAAIVYSICLEDNSEGSRKGGSSIYSIDFCWQICFHELTYNKHQSVQRRLGAPALQHRLK